MESWLNSRHLLLQYCFYKGEIEPWSICLVRVWSACSSYKKLIKVRTHLQLEKSRLEELWNSACKRQVHHSFAHDSTPCTGPRIETYHSVMALHMVGLQIYYRKTWVSLNVANHWTIFFEKEWHFTSATPIVAHLKGPMFEEPPTACERACVCVCVVGLCLRVRVLCVVCGGVGVGVRNWVWMRLNASYVEIFLLFLYLAQFGVTWSFER